MDNLTELQNSVDQLATQFYSSIYFLTSKADSLAAETYPPTAKTDSTEKKPKKSKKSTSTNNVNNINTNNSNNNDSNGKTNGYMNTRSSSRLSKIANGSTNGTANEINETNEINENSGNEDEEDDQEEDNIKNSCKELAKEVVKKSQEINLQISSLPGYNSTQEEQILRIENLQNDIKNAQLSLKKARLRRDEILNSANDITLSFATQISHLLNL